MRTSWPLEPRLVLSLSGRESSLPWLRLFCFCHFGCLVASGFSRPCRADYPARCRGTNAWDGCSFGRHTYEGPMRRLGLARSEFPMRLCGRGLFSLLPVCRLGRNLVRVWLERASRFLFLLPISKITLFSLAHCIKTPIRLRGQSCLQF